MLSIYKDRLDLLGHFLRLVPLPRLRTLMLKSLFQLRSLPSRMCLLRQRSLPSLGLLLDLAFGLFLDLYLSIAFGLFPDLDICLASGLFLDKSIPTCVSLPSFGTWVSS